MITVVLVIFVAICSARLRRRRLRNRVRLSNVPFDGLMTIRSSNAPKPCRAPVPGGSVYYQTTSLAPPPVQIPQYPPRGYDTYHNHLRSQGVPPSPIRTVPPPTAPVSPVSMRAPSGTSSRPISSLDTTPLSLRPSVHRNESTTSMPTSPSSLSSPVSPRSTQRNVAESSLPPLPSSPPLRSPPPAVSPPQSHQPVNPAPPFALTSMHTGTSYNNMDEPPPAYTPV